MKILIVDDDVLIRNWLSIMLKQIDGYAIELYEAADGTEALAICCEHHIDLVITDIKMPLKDGIQLLEELQRSFPHIQTAVLSSYEDLKYVRAALKLGSLDYILKPEMKMEDLVSIIEKMQRSKQKGTGAISHEEQERFLAQNKILKEFLFSEDSSPENFLGEFPYLGQGSLSLSTFRIRQQVSETQGYMILRICANTLEDE